MSKTVVICFACCLGALAGLAQAGPDKGERVWDDTPNQQRNADAQRRRADLRAAVQARTDGPAPSNPGAGGSHQLSPQERNELRQQLRQQRR
jgi:uncharacterized membrane protein